MYVFGSGGVRGVGCTGFEDSVWALPIQVEQGESGWGVVKSMFIVSLDFFC